MNAKKRNTDNVAQELADAMAEKMMQRFDADHGLGTYILDDDHNPVRVGTMEWARWFEDAKRHVGDTYTEHYRVSTVFLGLDHGWSSKGPPVLFETMVFGKNVVSIKTGTGTGIEHDMDRYCTWEEAEKGHAEMVRRVLEFEQSPQEKDA